MQRHEFEHVLGAAANVVGEGAFVVVGSQAILGTRADAPPALLQSMEVDLYPKEDPARAIEIDGALGDGSPFQAAYGYYAHGVGPETVTAPSGWEDRLVPVTVPPRPGSSQEVTAYCLEVHDLVLAKCAAGRGNDWAFAEEALRHGLVDPDELRRRAADMPVEPEHLEQLTRMLDGLIARL